MWRQLTGESGAYGVSKSSFRVIVSQLNAVRSRIAAVVRRRSVERSLLALNQSKRTEDRRQLTVVRRPLISMSRSRTPVQSSRSVLMCEMTSTHGSRWVDRCQNSLEASRLIGEKGTLTTSRRAFVTECFHIFFEQSTLTAVTDSRAVEVSSFTAVRSARTAEWGLLAA